MDARPATTVGGRSQLRSKRHLHHGGGFERERPPSIRARGGAAASHRCAQAVESRDRLGRGGTPGGPVPRGMERQWLLVPSGERVGRVGLDQSSQPHPVCPRRLVGRRQAGLFLEAARLVGPVGAGERILPTPPPTRTRPPDTSSPFPSLPRRRTDSSCHTLRSWEFRVCRSLRASPFPLGI